MTPSGEVEKAEANARPVGNNLSRNAFKEWAVVCDSIARGETSLIFRKGGIAEGRDGFRFKFSQFFLFPTFFHEQIEKTRLGNDRMLQPDPNSVVVTLFLEVEFTRWVGDLALLVNLDEFHVLKPSVLHERFHYDDRKGLHVAFVRAHLISPAWEFPFHRSYGGCRSWVQLPDPPINLRMAPVLPASEQERRRLIVQSALQRGDTPEIGDLPTA
jgi:hypothetical protein